MVFFDMVLQPRIREDKTPFSCQHPDIIDLECTVCGTEFNEPALDEVLESWKLRPKASGIKQNHQPNAVS